MGSILGDLWGFLRTRKRYWLLPIVVLLVLLAALVFLTSGEELAPFVYDVF